MISPILHVLSVRSRVNGGWEYALSRAERELGTFISHKFLGQGRPSPFALKVGLQSVSATVLR